MREIKFKGRTPNGEWLYGDLVHALGEPMIFPDEALDSADNYFVDPDTVGQYTGLSDKNGVEIYENYILRHDSGSVGVVRYEPTWGAYCFSARLSLNENGKLVRAIQSSPFFNSSNQYVAIANFHDNPELLEEVI